MKTHERTSQLVREERQAAAAAPGTLPRPQGKGCWGESGRVVLTLVVGEREMFVFKGTDAAKRGARAHAGAEGTGGKEGSA